MEISDFKIGEDFFTSVGKWRCTDIGTRTITAIRWPDPTYEPQEFEQAELWLAGPPYVLPEEVFNESEISRAYTNMDQLINPRLSGDENHPGFDGQDMKRLMGSYRTRPIQSPYMKRYRKGLLSFDRVRGDEILHAYDWEDTQEQGCLIKVLDIFQRTWSDVPLDEWMRLPACQEEDLARVMEKNPHRRLF